MFTSVYDLVFIQVPIVRLLCNNNRVTKIIEQSASHGK